MTLVPIDVPGNIAHDEVVDFTLSREPSAIHIEYLTDVDPELNQGDWSIVYGGVDDDGENGRFSWRFRNSSRDGNSWHVAPPGGSWNGIPFRLWADERPAPEYVGSEWETIYECDLRTLATSALLSTGDYTIDGQPWWIHGSSVARFVNGLGLELSESQVPSGGNNYAGAHAGLVIHSMADYDPEKYVAVQFRFGAVSASGIHVGTRIHAGGAAFGAPANAATTQRVIAVADSLSLSFWSSSFGINITRTVHSDGSPTNLSWLVMAAEAAPYTIGAPMAMDRNFRTHSFQRRVLGADMPAMEDLRSFGTTNDQGTGENPNFRIGVWAAGNAVLRTAYVTHVRVLQKPVPSL